MHILNEEEKLAEDTERLVRRIPFFNSVYESSEQQYKTLMQISEIVHVPADETVIRQGETDLQLYFLLKGELGVFLDDSVNSKSINSISPGEVFGILAMMTATPRSASIRPTNNKTAHLFRLDFNFISDETGLSPLSLEIKLLFYRMAVHNIRWTLELNRMSDPHHKLVDNIRQLPIVKEIKGSEAELRALKEQAKALADILFLWNQSTSGIQ